MAGSGIDVNETGNFLKSVVAPIKELGMLPVDLHNESYVRGFRAFVNEILVGLCRVNDAENSTLHIQWGTEQNLDGKIYKMLSKADVPLAGMVTRGAAGARLTISKYAMKVNQTASRMSSNEGGVDVKGHGSIGLPVPLSPRIGIDIHGSFQHKDSSSNETSTDTTVSMEQHIETDETPQILVDLSNVMRETMIASIQHIPQGEAKQDSSSDNDNDNNNKDDEDVA